MSFREAYLLGILFARGKIELSDIRRGRSEPYGRYILRIPVHKYSPDSERIVRSLQWSRYTSNWKTRGTSRSGNIVLTVVISKRRRTSSLFL